MAVICVPGITLAVDTASGVGMQGESLVVLNAVEAAQAAALSWGSVAGQQPAVWDAPESVWIDWTQGGARTAYKPGSSVLFEQSPELNKEVQIAGEAVMATVVDIAGSGYRFYGGDLDVTERLNVQESVSIDSALVIGTAATPLVIHVAEGAELTLKCLETRYTEVNGVPVFEQGSFVKTGAGTMAVTQAAEGAVFDMTVAEGTMVLAPGVVLNVGANELHGGTLQNVQLHVTGDLVRTLTGVTTTAHNLIKSADGQHAAVLTDVALHAGTSASYATLQNVVFAGDSTLKGYITYEETHSQREMGVATGSTLALEGVTFDLHGLSAGHKVLIVNKEVEDAADGLMGNIGLPSNISGLQGTITGWDTVRFVYSGVQINSAAVSSTVAGTVTIHGQHSGNLYWDGSEDGNWNPTTTNWSTTPGSDGGAVFTALSNVFFDAADAPHRDISVTQDMVVMNFDLSAGGYTFTGARIAVLGDANLHPESGNVTFNDQLVVQGNLYTSGSGSLELLGATTVVQDVEVKSRSTTVGEDLSVLGNFTVLAGNDTVAGRLNVAGNITAQNMNIAVNAGDKGGNSYNDALVNVTGNLTAENGCIIIGGTAEQHYLGVVKTGDLQVKTQEHEVYFDHLHADKLTVDKGAYVHVQTASAAVSVSASMFREIELAGTLALDAAGATYDKGYTVYVTDDAARLRFGSGCTINNLSIIGTEDADGYTDLDMTVQSRSATVTKMQDLGNLTVDAGTLTVHHATDAIHGSLTLNSGKLKLGENADNFMAADSGKIALNAASRWDVGTTSQSLSAKNVISLSGASVITGSANSVGLQFADGAAIAYADKDNVINANMVADDTLHIRSAQSGSSLNITGNLSGAGEVQLSGVGTVALSAANPFSGMVTVGDGSTLSVQNEVALELAGVSLNTGSTLALDTDSAVYLNSLAFENGATLFFSSIVGTKEFSAKDAALHVVNGAAGSGTLNISFADPLKTLTTYNLFTGLASPDGITLNVLHNGESLHASQYKVGFDAASGLLYMQTLMGNVWEGQGSNEQYTVWSTTNTDGNWSGNSNYHEDALYKAAIFGDLDGGSGTVTVQGEVNPREVYFVADTTEYQFVGDGHLADGTNIYKDGKGVVKFSLSNNATSDSALGDMDIQAGTLEFLASAAVGGTVTVSKDGSIVVNGAELKMAPRADGEFNYTVSAIMQGASATLNDVTMDAAGIRGMADARGSADKLLVDGNADLAYLTLTDFEAKGNVALSDVTLTSSDAERSHLLQNVTIGSRVEVNEDGFYTFSGNLTFEDTLTNHGKVTLTQVTNVEIGRFKYTPKVEATSGKSEYLYQLIQGNDVDTQAFAAARVSINGVNLATDLADGITATFTDNKDGSFTLSFADGMIGLPQWDESWGKTANAPGISRLYSSTADYFEMAAGNGGNSSYYMYDTLVNETNAAKVNGGNAIVVTLSSVATGAHAVGSRYDGKNVDHEVWIEDRSYIKNIIGGLDNKDRVTPNTSQNAATHILVNSFVQDDEAPPVDSLWYTWEKEYIIGGSRWCNQNAESFVTVQNGEIYNIFGGSCGATYDKAKEVEDEWGNTIYVEDWGNPVFKDESGNVVTNEWGSPLYVTQRGTTHIFVEGGKIGEIFAAGFYCTLEGTQWVNDRLRAVELVLTGGKLGGENLRVFGGGERGVVQGDIYIRMEGDAEIISRLLGGSNVGYVKGNIEMDLISGKAFRVDAAGLGWKYDDGYVDRAQIEGNVLVNLYSDFKLGHGSDFNLKAGIYGGMETTNYVTLIGDCTSTLHFAEGAKYELGKLVADGYTASDESIIVTGFDRFILEEGAHAVLALGYFDIDMDPSRTLLISGKGVVEVIGHGANFGRNIELTDGAKLKVSTSVIGQSDDGSDARTISVTSGTTLEITGYPVADSGYDAASPYAGLSFKTEISGDGVDAKGAIFKGTAHEADDEKALTANMVCLPYVKLTGNASAGVMNHEVLHMSGYNLGETTLDLQGYTFTKQGLGTFVARNVQMSEGTVLVHQGDFYIDRGSHGEKTDFVLADGTVLYLTSATSEEEVHTLDVRTLSGSGQVILNNAELTLHTAANSVYQDNYMDETQSYVQFLGTTGFAHAVFSGTIIDGDGAGRIVKDGDGVYYISGSNNAYTGGTTLQGGSLYLLGSSTAAEFSKGASTAASGVAGTGSIVWAGADAELYLGHNARLYNTGTTHVAGGVMTIGVEGAPAGSLGDFVGLHSQGENEELKYVTMGGEEYVEIETHNLKSIAVDAKYANGTDYKAGTEIDRNLMLLVKKSDWEAAQSTQVTGFVDTGYNEAIWSGVLKDANDAASAQLHKVGVGTLVLDQSNSYTGGTLISEGTLRLRGWGTAGVNAKDNIIHVEKDGATFMFSYTSGYGDEPTVLENDIMLTGTGDVRWLGHAATDGGTAALISAVGPAVTFTLSGDITGSGNVRHSGEGVLVLSGNSAYTGGTYASRGTVEVQSENGLGSTADGQGALTLEADADLRVTVAADYTGSRMVTRLASVANDIQGDVLINGTADTQRVLHMASQGYNAASTTSGENGVFLLNGAAADAAPLQAHSGMLRGNGVVAVSDASGRGASAVFDTMIDYSGDFCVEGDHAALRVNTGSYADGSISVSGRQASLYIGGDVAVSDGETLRLRSTGAAVSEIKDGVFSYGSGSGAVVATAGHLYVAAGGTLSVSKQATDWEYNLSGLQDNSVLNPVDAALPEVTVGETVYQAIGAGAGRYDGRFNAALAVNGQAVASAQAAGGVVLSGGSVYELVQSHLNLAGSMLNLDTLGSGLVVLNATTDADVNKINANTQLVLFSGVNGVYFGADGKMATADSGIYYTRADQYFTGCPLIDEQTLLVFDSYAHIAYLHRMTIPEPATATLSLLALAALAARRRRTN